MLIVGNNFQFLFFLCGDFKRYNKNKQRFKAITTTKGYKCYLILKNTLKNNIMQLNTKVKVTSDNENYLPYKDLILIITNRYIEDEEYIYDLDILNSNVTFPFSLYSWEFEKI